MAPEAIRALAGREARPLAVHVGGGIATRDAYHEQRAAHREALERGTAGAPERLALPVVTVPAASIVVAEGGPNYRPVVKSEGKQEKQARRRAKATAAAGGMAGGEVEPPLEGQPPVVGSVSELQDTKKAAAYNKHERHGVGKGRLRKLVQSEKMNKQRGTENGTHHTLQDTQPITNTTRGGRYKTHSL